MKNSDLLDYKMFMEKKHNHRNKFGCVMLEVEVPNWEKITSIVNKEDLYNPDGTYGIENKKDIHITLIFGLHETVKNEDVDNIIKNIDRTKFDIKANGIGTFHPKRKDFDVVKINISCDYLNELNKEFRKLDNTSDFDTYNSHLTLAYVKKGSADKYIDKEYKCDVEPMNEIIYSKVDGEKIKYKI